MNDQVREYSEADSLALREERQLARRERERMANAEGPLARNVALARVQEEARQVLSQSRTDSDYLGDSLDISRDVDSVAEQTALQQEINIVRRTVQEKERLVDITAAQCRRLEDELEDQRLAYDGLKQDLERKKLSLAAAREQVERISHERNEIEERYQALLSSRHPAETRSQPVDKPRSGLRPSAARFLGGLATGIIGAGVAFVLLLQLDPPTFPDFRPSIAQEPVAPPRPQAVLRQASSPVAEDAGLAGEPLQARPVVLGTERDRLSDGSGGPLMLVLAGGDFIMGRQMALLNDDEGPAHGVRLGPFAIGATEVTFEEYDRFARATGRRFPGDFGWGRGTRPVVDVSWSDARAYARWLSGRSGRAYRLPSESEWEYAAAAGRRSFFWWGHTAGQGRAVCFDCGTIWDNYSSAPVGTFAPNPLGLYDTAGNVMEWVEDCYHPSYAGAPTNGRAWDEAGCRFRVARGGAFNKPARSMHATARHRFVPETRINALGFRLARDE